MQAQGSYKAKAKAAEVALEKYLAETGPLREEVEALREANAAAEVKLAKVSSFIADKNSAIQDLETELVATQARCQKVSSASFQTSGNIHDAWALA
jgi:chromosome segregation ATPase